MNKFIFATLFFTTLGLGASLKAHNKASLRSNEGDDQASHASVVIFSEGLSNAVESHCDDLAGYAQSIVDSHGGSMSSSQFG